MPPTTIRRLSAVAVVVALVSTIIVFTSAPFATRSAGVQALARQNVLLILTDDMRLDSLWVMDRLNQLAQRGTTFRSFFVTTPICCPSRSTLLTGLYAHNHGVLANREPLGGFPAFNDQSTLATWLRDGGVRTGLVGRYINGYASTYHPPGWDFFYAMWGAGEDLGNYYNYTVTDNGAPVEFRDEPDDYSTRVLQRAALRFLDDAKERPFFLLVSPRAPHGPALRDPDDRGRTFQFNLPPSYDEQDVGDKPPLGGQKSPLAPSEVKYIEGLRRDQLRSLLGVDRLIGALVDQLQADGRLDSTWIIFSSDNGLMLGEHRWRPGKACAYEECVRVPLVIIPPAGTSPPVTDDHLVANIDLAPTVAAMLGVTPGAPVDGASLLPLLTNPASPWRDELLLEVWQDYHDDLAFRALRTPGWKYVRYDNGEEELYDQIADLHELESQHANPELTELKADLARRLDALLTSTTR